MSPRVSPTVVLTRPAAQVGEWVQALQQAGLPAQALPLIDIAPVQADVAQAAWLALTQASTAPALLMFVSANAVQHFFAAAPDGQAWPACVRAAATGPGTVKALLRAGVPAAQIVAPDFDQAQFDSEALWQRLANEPWQGRQAWVIRGEGGRDWLAQQWQAAGAQTRYIEVYRRGLPVWSPAQQQVLQAALADPASHLWVVSSAQALAHWQQLGHPAPAAVLATHERIAQAAQAMGVAKVLTCAPKLDDVIARAQTWHTAQLAHPYNGSTL